MRIVGGKHRGRTLKAPAGLDVRPTSDRVRESLFNVLAHGLGVEWEGTSVVDVYAGTGALGLEALSRGAAHATFIDHAGAANKAIRENAAALGEWRNVTLLKLDAARLAPPPLAAQAPCTVAFLDPPYGQGLVAPALLGLRNKGWIGDGSVVVAERGAGGEFEPPTGFEAADERTYGAAKVVFLHRRR